MTLNATPSAADPHRIVTSKTRGWATATLPFDTLPKLFWSRVRELGPRTMMRQKDMGLWRAYSWNDVATIAGEIGAGLASLGFARGEIAAVLANTCREWMWVDLAVQSMGGVCNGIYPTDAAEQVQYLCADSATVYLFVEDEEQLDKYLEMRARLPQIRKVIVVDMEGLTALDDPQVLSLEQLRAIGRKLLQAQPRLVEERVAAGVPDDVAILVYTSGTTGRPKGAVITHKNMCAVLSGSGASLYQDMPDGGERVAFLPLCHIAERLIGGYV